MIWTMRPVATPLGKAGAGGVAASVTDMSDTYLSSLEGFGAGDDLDQLLGDLRLAGSVLDQGEGGDHVAGVARGGVHGGHLGSEEADLVLHHGRQDLGGDIA